MDKMWWMVWYGEGWIQCFPSLGILTHPPPLNSPNFEVVCLLLYLQLGVSPVTTLFKYCSEIHLLALVVKCWI